MERICKILLLGFLEVRYRYGMERLQKNTNKNFEVRQELQPEGLMGASGPF